MGRTDAVAAESRPPPVHAKPYEIRAFWVDDGRVSPTSMDFDLHTIRPVPGRGVVASGNRLLLRVHAGVPFVTLGWARGRLGAESAGRVVTGLPGGRALFAGYSIEVDDEAAAGWPTGVTTTGYLLGLSNPGWASEPVPALDDAESWRFVDLQSTSEAGVYALVEIMRSRTRTGGPWRRLFSRTDSTWTPIACPGAHLGTGSNNEGARAVDGASEVTCGMPGPQIRAICVSGVGALWAAVVEGVAQTARSPSATTMYFYRDNVGWTLTSLPANAASVIPAVSGALACDHFGAWLLAHDVRPAGAGAVGLYHLREHARSSHVALPADVDSSDQSPDAQPPATLRLLAVDHSLRPWISAEPAAAAGSTFRLDSGGWREFSLPEIAGVRHYTLADMTFDDRGDGWAVANVASGASTGRRAGLLLYFHDEHWVQRGWSWHWWQERYFGLLGPDR